MEQLYTQVIRLLKKQLPALSLVDEDCGQLEAGIDEDTYPVTFPCALVGSLEADWENMAGGRQRGNVLFTVRLAVDCYDDTHLGSGTEDKVAGRLLMADSVSGALQGFRPWAGMSALMRTKSRFYTLPHGIKVYETTFALRLTE